MYSIYYVQHSLCFKSKFNLTFIIQNLKLKADLRDQIEVLVKGMFEYSGELEKFQDDIRDFLIDIREVGDKAESQQRAEEELNAELDLLRNSS